MDTVIRANAIANKDFQEPIVPKKLVLTTVVDMVIVLIKEFANVLKAFMEVIAKIKIVKTIAIKEEPV